MLLDHKANCVRCHNVIPAGSEVPMAIVCGYKHYLCPVCSHSFSSLGGLPSRPPTFSITGSSSIFDSECNHNDFDVCEVLGVIPIL